MAKKYPKCSTCDHFTPFEDGDGRGGCMLLSEVEDNETATGGAEGEFWCKENFGCSLHSSIDSPVEPSKTPGSEESQIKEPSQSGKRASEYLS